MIVYNSVQDKRYLNFIELVKKQYSGNEHSLVKRINPETNGKTKNDHFQEMFMNMITYNIWKLKLFFSILARRPVPYASVDNLKLIHRHGWTFFTTLNGNRKVSLSREIGYRNLDELVFDQQTIVKGLSVKLKGLSFMVKLFNRVAWRKVALNGDIDWVITNDLAYSVNLFASEIKKARSQRNHLACCYHAWVSLKVKAKQLNKTIYQIRKELFFD